MKDIAIFTMGTRGDVQPYIFLAKELTKAGYNVTIGTHPCWSGLILDANVGFVPIGPDIDIEFETAAIRKKVKNPVFSMLKTMQFVFNIIENSTADIYDACKNKDLVIVSHSQMGATEAEALGIKRVSVTLQTEMVPQVHKKKSIGDKIFGFVVAPQMVKPYNKLRKKYSLKPLKALDEVISKDLNLIPISRYFTQPNPFWDESNKVVGYWYDDDTNYKPDEKMREFLSSGDKPIILALGAMSFESEAELAKLDIFAHAFNKMGFRAIIQGFNKSMPQYNLPKTMIHAGAVPHSWLFKQGYCVIHHCGFGTTASAMLYGAPSIPVPHILDQFSFANRLAELNVATPPLKASELSVEKLCEAIQALQNNYAEIYKSVISLSQKMQQEQGLKKAVELIQSTY